MLVLLMTLYATQGQPVADTVLAAARRAVVTLSDTAAARAAGYSPITEAEIPDGLPFQGLHWFNNASDTLPNVRLDRPTFIMFGQVNGVLQRVGVAYSASLRLQEPPPAGLAGDQTAVWHDHYWCEGVPDVQRAFLVNQREQCSSRGGTLAPRRTSMVHVWTDVASPYGQYGHDNPALPFAAVGLAPPTAHDTHDPARARSVRALAMALGETYDARLPLTRRIERVNRDRALGDSLIARRAAIVSLVSLLKQAEKSGDRAAYDRTAARVVQEWEAMLTLYERMASPDLRQRVRRRHEEVVAVSAHH